MPDAPPLFPLIDAPALRRLLAEPDHGVQVLDCRFDLSRPQAGADDFARQHIPGARYLHLEHDLSGPGAPVKGRHPLPEPVVLAARLGALGVGATTRVVACDTAGGMMAARLWWLCQWLGHHQVQVLDGGLAAWLAAGGGVRAGQPEPAPPAQFPLRPPLVATVDLAEVRASVGRAQWRVVDARAADRFRGENETLDPVGGHIPGAVNRPFAHNLTAEGRFKPADALRAEWQQVLAGREAAQSVQQCGSGVTACHNLLAMAVAGLPGARLYPGSWSEWCRQPQAVVATG